MEEVKKQGMESLFVPYEIALALKELGFDESCFAKFFQQDGNTPFIQIGESEIEEAESAGDDITFECNAPLYQQAFRWFREKYEIHSSVFWVEIEGFIYWNYRYSYLNGRQVESVNRSITFFDTPEEAEFECLRKLIEIVKQK
jgi:hypothetical protein